MKNNIIDQISSESIESILKAMEEMIMRDEEKRVKLRKALNDLLDVPMAADEVE
jgi:uncharacterized protein YeeX (DUF496 family)